MLAAILLALTTLSTPALAQDASKVPWSSPGAEKFDEPQADLDIELGGTYVSGNSEFFSLQGKIDSGYRWDRNKLSFTALATLGQAKVDLDGDGILSEAERSRGFRPNAERYAGQIRYDRFLTSKDGLYVLAGAYRDTFAGFNLRSNEQVGYSRVFVDGVRTIGEGDDAIELRTEFKGEFGIDYAQEFYVAGVDPQFYQFIAAKVMLSFLHQFNTAVSFKNQITVFESLFDVADLRLLNEVSLTARLSKIMQFKVSNTIIFDNVPVTGYRKLDQTTGVTLVISLL